MISHENTLQNDAAPVSHVWLYDLPEGYTEVSDRDNYIPYEPTPVENMQLNPYYQSESSLYIHQESVRRSHDILYAQPPIGCDGMVLVPQDIQEIVDIDRVVGQVRRNMENMRSYADWVEPVRQSTVHWTEMPDKYITDSSVLFAEVNDGLLKNDPILVGLHEKLLTGEIQPEEVLYFLQKTCMRSAEVAKVTHPYGYRINIVSDARKAIASAVDRYNGVIYPRAVTPYERFHFDDKGLVTYKRRIGHVFDDKGRRIYIIERQSAAIHNATGLDIEDMVQQDADAQEIIPLSTMWYAAREAGEEYNERMKLEYASGRVRKALGEQSIGDMLMVEADGS